MESVKVKTPCPWGAAAEQSLREAALFGFSLGSGEAGELLLFILLFVGSFWKVLQGDWRRESSTGPATNPAVS